MRIPSSFSLKSRPGFTLVELLVVIMIIVTLASLTLMVMGTARRSADKTSCLKNLSELYKGMTEYSRNNYGCVPINGMEDNEDTEWNESEGWMVALAPYLYGSEARVPHPMLGGEFRCPADSNVMAKESDRIPASMETISYVCWSDGENVDTRGIRLDNVDLPSRIPWLTDGTVMPKGKNVATREDFDNYVKSAEDRHDAAVDVLYLNGSVKTIDDPTFEKVKPSK